VTSSQQKPRDIKLSPSHLLTFSPFRPQHRHNLNGISKLSQHIISTAGFSTNCGAYCESHLVLCSSSPRTCVHHYSVVEIRIVYGEAPEWVHKSGKHTPHRGRIFHFKISWQVFCPVLSSRLSEYLRLGQPKRLIYGPASVRWKRTLLAFSCNPSVTCLHGDGVCHNQVLDPA
jgi:hypothetical protein